MEPGAEPKDTKTIVEEMNTLWSRDLKALQEKAKENGETLKQLVDRDPISSDQYKTISAQLDELERKFQRPGAGGGQRDEIKNVELWAHYFGKGGQPAPMDEVTPERVREAKQAFRAWLRKGDERMTYEETKELSTQDNANGGYLVYPEFAQEIIKDLTEMSPVRSIARVRQTATNVFKVPKRLTLPTAAWVGEGATDALTNATYDMKDLPNGTMRATSRATREQLGDAAFNMEEQLRLDFRESFQAAEGAAFVSGDGVNKPTGFLTDANVDATTGTGAVGEITFESLVNLSHGLNVNYLANARFVMNLGTLGQVRLLEDSAGNLIFQPAAQGVPSTIVGFPWTLLQDMPAIAAGTTPVAFGDFRRAYWIIERVMFDLLRDPFTAKRDGAVEFTAFMRVGGDVVLPSALRKLTVDAA